MSYKNKCLNMINFLNKRIENKNEKLGLSVYKPDSQNRIRLVMINKKNGSQRELSNVFLN
jgi:muramidase (phage lysozyme)